MALTGHSSVAPFQSLLASRPYIIFEDAGWAQVCLPDTEVSSPAQSQEIPVYKHTHTHAPASVFISTATYIS